MTWECSSNSYKSSVELLIALRLFCTNIRIAIVGQKASALSDVAFCPWQGPTYQLIQKEGKEMLFILHDFCFVLSLVQKHRPLLPAIYLLISSETEVRLNSCENVGEVLVWLFFSLWLIFNVQSTLLDDTCGIVFLGLSIYCGPSGVTSGLNFPFISDN